MACLERENRPNCDLALPCQAVKLSDVCRRRWLEASHSVGANCVHTLGAKDMCRSEIDRTSRSFVYRVGWFTACGKSRGTECTRISKKFTGASQLPKFNLVLDYKNEAVGVFPIRSQDILFSFRLDRSDIYLMTMYAILAIA